MTFKWFLVRLVALAMGQFTCKKFPCDFICLCGSPVWKKRCSGSNTSHLEQWWEFCIFSVSQIVSPGSRIRVDSHSNSSLQECKHMSIGFQPEVLMGNGHITAQKLVQNTINIYTISTISNSLYRRLISLVLFCCGHQQVIKSSSTLQLRWTFGRVPVLF